MRFGRAVCGDLASAEAREWLLTNGRGGYAMGTFAGTLTRAYHGLLIAAIDAPANRRLVLARIDLDIVSAGTTYQLATNRWMSGAIAPQGYRDVLHVSLDDGLPAWTYALGDTLLTVTLAMPHGADAIALALHVDRAAEPIDVHARVVAADRDHHGGTLPDPASFITIVVGARAEIALPACGRRLHLSAPGATLTPASDRYANYALPHEAERGLPASADGAHVLDLVWHGLAEGAGCGVVASLDAPFADDAATVVVASGAANRARAAAQPTALRGALALAADAFVVERDAAGGGPPGLTVIAGYPWFTDWGRDTMLALPGLLLATGRVADAASVLRTFAAYENDGLIPNRFPDAGGTAEYNTVDAALLFIGAVRAYDAVAHDDATLAALWPALRAIVAGYRDGTRFGIGMDADGLIRAGADGLQLTWMDARVGDLVVTPRRGKPIEINAMWYDALRTCAALAPRVGDDPMPYAALADRAHAALPRFWNAASGWCFDVLDGPDGDDASLRPNQLFAVALAADAFTPQQQRAIVDVCAARLWTPLGLRTLDPADPRYRGTYGGDQAARDGAYHQGTAWPWLIMPFVRAHVQAYRDKERARTYLTPLLEALDGALPGSLAEIADGDAPNPPRGCPAQAWSVAAMLDCLQFLG
jgi:glycogen debranching enzyme